MHKILKKYYIAMMIFLLPSIFIIVCCSYRTNYGVISVGGVTKVDNRFDVESGYESKNLYSLYVYSSNNATLFQTWIADLYDIYDKYEMSDTYSHMTDLMWYTAGVIQREQSQEASAIIAYEKAAETNSNIKIDYEYLGVIVRATSVYNNVFELGDIVTHVNDIKVESYEHYISLERTIGTKLTYLRDNKVYNVVLDNNSNWSCAYYDKYQINSSTPSYSISSTLNTGPSAGMMQTLSIYNQLVEYDVTVKDGVSRTIAGTGTMEFDGRVGAIGGDAQKVYSAYNSGASILIMSKEDEEEGQKAFDNLKNNTTMKIFFVSNFDEVLECLK